MLLEMITSPPV